VERVVLRGQAEKHKPATPATWLLTKNTHRVFFYVRPSEALIFAHIFNYFLRVFVSSPFGLGSLVTFFLSRKRK
jgi:hypothetical protein